MNNDLNPITKAGYHMLEQRIEALKQQRPDKIAALKAARALGDLSENADYSAAKRDLRHLESQLRFTQKQLQFSKIIEVSDDGIVSIGKKVTIEFLDDHENDTFIIVGISETNIDENKISLRSPLGQALHNHKVGDIVTINSPDSVYTVKINAISLEV